MSKDFKVKNGLQVTTNITASGNISSSGTLIGQNISISNVALSDTNDNATHYFTIFEDNKALETTNGIIFNPSTDTVTIGGNKIYLTATGGHITASGNISSSGAEHIFGGLVKIIAPSDNTSLLRIQDVDKENNFVFSIDSNQHSDFHIERNDTDKIRFNTYWPAQIDNDTYESFGGLILGGEVDRGDKTGYGLYVSSGSDSGSAIFKGASSPFIVEGNITASGDISSSGKIIGTRFRLPNGQFLGSANDDLLFSTGIQVSTHITASGNIKSGGNLELTASSAGHITATGTGSFGAVTSTGTISSSGNIHLENQKFIYLATNDTADNRIRYHDGQDLISIKTENIYLDTANGVGIKTFTPTKALQVEGDISASGFLQTDSYIQTDSDITASGDISASGTIFGQFERVDTSEDAAHYVVFGGSGDSVLNVTNGFAFNPSNDKLTLAGTIQLIGNTGTITGLTNLSTTNITASANISASGTITMLTASIGGGIFTSASLAAGGGGGGGTTTNALTAGAGLNNGGGTFNGGTARTFSVDSASFAPFYSASMNDFTTTGTGSFGAVTSTGTISSSKRIYGESLYLEGNRIRIDNNAFEFTLGLDANSITSSGNISASNTSGVHTFGGSSTFTGNTSFNGVINNAGATITTGHLLVNTAELTGSFHGGGNLLSGDVAPFLFNYGDGATFSGSLTNAGFGYGEIISHLPINGPSAGDVVYLTGADWRHADADGLSKSSKMIGVALADGNNVPGPVLIRGVVRLGAGHIHDSSGQNGDPLYLSTESAHVQFAAPSGNGDVARIVGYCMDEDNDIIYFNPSNTFVEVS